VTHVQATSTAPIESDADVLAALKDVIDPELGIAIVELGLIYRAARTATGIEVDLTMTSRSCPLADLLRQQAQEALQARFPESPAIRVELVWSPPWSPDRLSPEGRRRLGWTKTPRRPHRLRWFGWGRRQ
jgi:metal-sulfur cluster biosynthetic enzyme